ncbi:MAG: selenocysteine-specific translation elongation factor [Verrucomicrobiota bacterium]
MRDKRHYILGTAGHIDHGKSALVRALTGVDPDRLPEEKARGMTIDLGFAGLDLEATDGSGDTLAVGVVDVPGHADFLKNMLTGISAVDFALLVIAADDGWMAQTEEHYQILNYLNVGQVVIALSKADLAEDIELVRGDIAAHLQGGRFEDAPIIATSVKTGEGIETLSQVIAEKLSVLPPVRDSGKPRLLVDRVFGLRGVGTVVTGTLRNGSITAGSDLMILPDALPAHVRGLQSHNEKKDFARPGSRAALNLVGLSRRQSASAGIARGSVLTLPDTIHPSTLLDVEVHRLERDFARSSLLKSGREFQCYMSCGSRSARMHFGDTIVLEPGDSTFAQLRFKEPVCAWVGDRFVLRDLARRETVAGGVILDVFGNPRAFRKAPQRVLLEERAREPNSMRLLILSALQRDGYVALKLLCATSPFAEKELRNEVDSLQKEGLILAKDDWLFLRKWWDSQSKRILGYLEKYHKDQPDHVGARVDAVERAFSDRKQPKVVFDLLVESLIKAHSITREEIHLRLSYHRPRLDESLEINAQIIRDLLSADPHNPPNLASLLKEENGAQVVEHLLKTKELLQLDTKTVISSNGYEAIKGLVIQYLEKESSATLSELREQAGSSRRIMMPLLERLDREGITLREGDQRRLR